MDGKKASVGGKSCAFFQFVLGNTGKMSCDKVLKVMKLGNESLLQYYHERVTSVVDRAKNLSNAELIIKLASSSVGERIFRDLRSEIYIPSEEKVSADDGENGRLTALKYGS